MKKKNWKIIIVVLMMMLLLPMVSSVNVKALEIPEYSEYFYVNDYAGLLSDQTEKYIVEINDKLWQATEAQVVVTTIESLMGDNLEEFATRMFNTWQIGSAQQNNGVLILLAEKERQIRIEVGYGLSTVISDTKAGKILDDYVVPYLKDDLWDEGITNCFNAVLRYLQQEYGVDVGANAPLAKKENLLATSEWQMVIAGVISLVAGIVTYKIFGKNSSVILLMWNILMFAYFLNKFSLVSALANMIISGVGTLFGYFSVAPDSGGGSGGYYSSGSSRSSSSSSSTRSGGGGRSSGGGASKGF